MPTWVQYLLWELAAAAACWTWSPPGLPALQRGAFCLALNITAVSLIASALSFAGSNSAAAYLAIAALLAGYAVWARRREALPAPSIPGAVAAAFVALLLAVTIRPLEEVDSLYNLNYVVEWMANLSTPYHNAFEYPAFWELTYVPALVLAKDAGVLWVQSLKPVVLLGCVLLLIAREIVGQRQRWRVLAVLPVAGLLAFPHLWLIPSGVSTIKNDMVAAVGQAIAGWLAIRATREGRNLLSSNVNTAWVAMAAVFLSAKALGLILVGAGFAAVVVWGRADRKIWRAVVPAFALWMLAAGHYFVRKVLLYGNPFYPFEARLGPIVLPGTADLSSTSIRASLGNPELWRLLIAPESGISPLGILFPVFVVAIVAGSIFVVARAAARRRICADTPMAMVQLICWGTYIVLPYSASAQPGDLHFLRHDLNSVRYVEGALLAAELYIVVRLWRSLGESNRAGRVAVAGVVAAQAASCVWLIAQRSADVSWMAAVFAAMVAAGWWLIPSRRWQLATGVFLLLPGALFTADRLRVTKSLAGLPAAEQPLWGPLADAAPTNIYYVIDERYSQQPCGRFLLHGRRMQHRVTAGPAARIPDGVRYIAWMRLGAPPKVPPGYAPMVDDSAGMLWRKLD